MTAIGLVGFGRWGKLIFRDLRALGVEVHVAVPSATARDDAMAVGAAAAVADCEAFSGLDGYVVAVPTAMHASIIHKLIRHGRPIYVEKPFTSNPADARDLVEIAADLIFVMDKWRYHPGVEAIASLVKSGELGDVLTIRTYRLGWANPHRDVNAAWILLPHDLSIAFEILGYLPAASRAIGTLATQADSNLIATLRDIDGGPEIISEISISHPVSRRSVVVIGTKGSVQLADSYDDRIFVVMGAPGSGDGIPQQVEVNTGMPLQRELAAFVGHIQGGEAPRSSAREGLLVVERIAELLKLAGQDGS